MTKTPKWLPDGSGIDPESLNGDTVVETLTGFYRARRTVGPIVRVFADVTPPRPDPRVEVVMWMLLEHHDLGRPSVVEMEEAEKTARAILDALDAMGADQ